MCKTLSLSRRAHLFVRDDALFIKLQAPHNRMPETDIYILKRFSIERLKEIRDWADSIIEESENNNVKAD